MPKSRIFFILTLIPLIASFIFQFIMNFSASPLTTLPLKFGLFSVYLFYPITVQMMLGFSSDLTLTQITLLSLYLPIFINSICYLSYTVPRHRLYKPQSLVLGLFYLLLIIQPHIIKNVQIQQYQKSAQERAVVLSDFQAKTTSLFDLKFVGFQTPSDLLYIDDDQVRYAVYSFSLKPQSVFPLPGNYQFCYKTINADQTCLFTADVDISKSSTSLNVANFHNTNPVYYSFSSNTKQLLLYLPISLNQPTITSSLGEITLIYKTAGMYNDKVIFNLPIIHNPE